MKNNIQKILLAILASTILLGCVKETFKPFEDDCSNPNLKSTKTIADIYAVAINPTGNPANSPVYTADDIIEGYVVSSDEGGNFYQSMYIQPLNKTKGFNLSVDIKSAYIKDFQPGKKVYLKLKGLAYANTTAFAVGLIFGAKPTDQFAVDRLDNYENFLIPTCDVINEELLVNTVTIAEATANDNYLNTLVEIKNVQFDDATATKSFDLNTTNASDDNTSIVNVQSSKKLAVRTSRFANFAGFATPAGNGTIRGVLTKYNSDYQIVLRTERDVKMNNPRILTPSLPIGASNITFPGTLFEQFTFYGPDTSIFPKYINDKIAGNKYWTVKTFSNNNYLEMGSFLTSSANKTYFMIPVDFTAANYLTFKKKARFYNGNSLNIYYIKESDFTAGFLQQFLLTDITSKFNIVYPALGTSESRFSGAGIYNIPEGLTGNGYFVFEYNGNSSGITTTIQLDDIIIN